MLKDSADVFRWLLEDTGGERYIDVVFVEMCERLMAAGVPVARATLFFDGYNPEWLGARILWTEGMRSADLQTFDYGIDERPEYLNSPMHLVNSGTAEVRQRLEGDVVFDYDFKLYTELKAAANTDYVAWPLQHTLGKRHAATFASTTPGGFSDEHLGLLREILPALSLVSEVRLKNRLTRTLLDTYVGPHASEQILAGATTRGSGFTVGAAIMICDLRDFTAISDALPRDDVLHMLNGFFDAMGASVASHGGEILKFMGDGFLAIFDLSDPLAPTNLLRAIVEGQKSMDMFNDLLTENGMRRLECGTGVHVGDVMYGNIGSRNRLDFTAIGPAVNVASRLETLTKELKRPVLLSREFVNMAACQPSVEPVGLFQLRGLGRPVEVFAFVGDCTVVDENVS